jgi:MPBQ/MSBQ methyltransferase
MSERSYETSLNKHYGRAGLMDIITAALKASGKNLDMLSPDDLSPVAEFHIGGQQATLELAHIAGVGKGLRLLDIGSGLGGPARTLALRYGCNVTGIDLTEEFCRTATMLSELSGVHDQVSFLHANALDMPFEDESFHLVWTQQAGMNIEDKDKLYKEAYRVLALGGRLVFQEILRGSVAPLHFPVPWAREASLNFLREPGEVRALLAEVGFREMVWHDVTAQYLTEYRKAARRNANPASLPPLGLHLILGPEFGTMLQNLVRNFEENRVVLIQSILKKS